MIQCLIKFSLIAQLGKTTQSITEEVHGLNPSQTYLFVSIETLTLYKKSSNCVTLYEFQSPLCLVGFVFLFSSSYSSCFEFKLLNPRSLPPGLSYRQGKLRTVVAKGNLF